MNPCSSYTQNGTCQHGNNCKFAHIVTLHKTVEASSVVQQPNNNNNYNNRNNYNNNNNNPQKAPVSAVSIWETNGTIQIFTGSHDGYWRLFNANQQFQRTAETPMRGKVECIEIVQNSYLYCGFEAPSSKMPDVPCGQVNAWNLQNPSPQAIEFFMDPTHLPYAHNQAVSALTVGEGSNAPVVTGSKDGTIRVWTLSATDGKFTLVRTLPGHLREVTALVLIPGGNLLWSGSIDGSIRIWDLSQAVPEQACQYCITKETQGNLPVSPGGNNPQGGANAAGVGHTNAVTSMVLFPSAAGSFVLSASLDGSIKAWDTNTAQCVASENHTEGVVTMTLAHATPSPQQQPPPQDGQGPPVLLIGLESGNIACRNLVQTQKTPAFALLFVLAQKYSAAHRGAVKSIAAGPSATFYSGGADGNLMVWQFTGDLNL